MKPAAFEYHAPRSVAEALDLLAQYGDEGKVLAGGQSLVPLMNFRLARPAHLIDLNRIAELSYVRPHDGGLAFGAMTRQYVLEEDPQVAARNPLLPVIARHIGHVQIRHRGTIGGSIAHADPVAELPLAATLLDAELVIRSQDGERVARPEEFFLHYLMTSLAPTELLCEVRFPALSPRAGWSFQEFARRHGDFAIVAAAAVLEADANGVCTAARVAVAGGAPTPQRSSGAEAALVGQKLAPDTFEAAAEAAAAEADPESDIHASADYRRKMVRVFVRRALEEAASRLPKGS
ncbi:MAG: xanthine dehydrogenase family protein subunit M [Chloroflexi bacterium]|nr:xanthine dehydrogenase family protein subunit M [Chloroflexota bacterium]